MVILAGGVGSRFWPVSTAARPKQLLPLGGERPLIRDTLDRIAPAVPTERIIVVTGAELADPLLRELPELTREQLLLEPRARGTAPALAWAAWEIARRDPGGVMVSLHADHVISPDDLFRDLLGRVAGLAARHDRLFTLGVPPTHPDTGYGYIRVGDALAGAPDARAVARFVEKPDHATAESYVRAGRYLWNSGIFVWRAAFFLQQLRAHTPELADVLPLLERGDVAGFFRDAPTLSVDEGVLERSDRVSVVTATFNWDDVGTWDAVARTREPDGHGNVSVGPAHLRDSEGCITWAEGGTVVLFGARDLVVVHLPGLTLVLPRERAAELKRLVDGLPDHLRQPPDRPTARATRSGSDGSAHRDASGAAGEAPPPPGPTDRRSPLDGG